jgi:hypothetical protein
MLCLEGGNVLFLSPQFNHNYLCALVSYYYYTILWHLSSYGNESHYKSSNDHSGGHRRQEQSSRKSDNPGPKQSKKKFFDEDEQRKDDEKDDDSQVPLGDPIQPTQNYLCPVVKRATSNYNCKELRFPTKREAL